MHVCLRWPIIQTETESRHIGGLEISHHFFAIAAYIPSRPLLQMSSGYSMDGQHSGKTAAENPPLEFQGPVHDPFVIGQLGINLYLILTLEKPLVGLISNGRGDDSLRCWSRINTISLIKRGRLDRNPPWSQELPQIVQLTRKVCRSVCAPQQTGR